MERHREELQGEISNLRSLNDSERNRNNIASENIHNLEGEKRIVEDAVIQRGKDIRDLEEDKDRVENHLKAVEIERDTIHERMQVTVS